MELVSPWMRTIELPLADTNYNLLDEAKVLDANCPRTVGSLFIQTDVEADEAVFNVGNPLTLDATDRGVDMFAGQPFSISSVVNNISLQHFSIRCNEAGKSVNITLVVF